MDLVTLQKNAILVPTPGQTEQEYLAAYLMEKKIFFTCKQENFSLKKSMESGTIQGPLLVSQHGGWCAVKKLDNKNKYKDCIVHLTKSNLLWRDKPYTNS